MIQIHSKYFQMYTKISRWVPTYSPVQRVYLIIKSIICILFFVKIWINECRLEMLFEEYVTPKDIN